MSNLTADKGLREFIDILERSNQQRLPIRGILAGPVAEGERSFVENSKAGLAAFLDYRGPVYADEKARFFGDVDVFVFLTTYLNEAQPTVLYEAMARGIPVVSFDRGCIRNQVGAGGYVFPHEANGVCEMLTVLQALLEEPDRLAELREATLRQFEDDRRRGEDVIAQLFEPETSKSLRVGEQRPSFQL